MLCEEQLIPYHASDLTGWRQTYSDLEVVLVNDGGVHVGVAEAHSGDMPITYVPHEKNGAGRRPPKESISIFWMTTTCFRLFTWKPLSGIS